MKTRRSGRRERDETQWQNAFQQGQDSCPAPVLQTDENLGISPIIPKDAFDRP
jgi:hypothetical protein